MEVSVKVTKKRKMCDTVAHVRSNYSEEVSVAPQSASLDASDSELSSTENTGLSKPPATCCASNGSSDVTNGNSKFVDLDDTVEVAKKENNSEFEERETIFSSELKVELHKLESTPKLRHAKSRRRDTAAKTPSEADLDEFFATAEKDLLERSAEKYNFDFMKEKPLEGRYEWVRL